MKKDDDDWGVHQTHCCFKHGCKYGYEAMQKECAVYAGKIKQEYTCESCDNDSSIKLFFGCYIEVSNAVAKIAEVKKTKSKYCLNEQCSNKDSLMAKYSVCPYCGSNIDFKDVVKIEYTTETNLGLTDTWEVLEVREYPEIKKLYFFKEDLKSLELLLIQSSDIGIVNCSNVDFDQLKDDNEKSKVFISMFEKKHVEAINLLKQNFSNVNIKFGLISFPTNYYREYGY